MLVRRESARDGDAVARVCRRAFAALEPGREPVEVDLLERLRRCPAWLPHLALVAVVDGEVVGHAVATRATIEPSRGAAVGLGPVAVLPDHQRRGVGTALLHTLLGAADATAEPLVGVLGDPAYYSRFGFVPAVDHRIDAPDPDWGAHFQVRPLSAHRDDLTGRFRYAPPFEEL